MSAPVAKALKEFGWAAGSYSCRCFVCGAAHEADKRAIRCMDCAGKAVIAAANRGALPISPPHPKDVPLATDDPDTALARATLHGYGIMTSPYTRGGGDHPMMEHLLRLIGRVRALARVRQAAGWRAGREAAVEVARARSAGYHGYTLHPKGDAAVGAEWRRGRDVCRHVSVLLAGMLEPAPADAAALDALLRNAREEGRREMVVAMAPRGIGFNAMVTIMVTWMNERGEDPGVEWDGLGRYQPKVGVAIMGDNHA